MPELLTAKEVSKILKVGLKRVYELIEQNEIKFVKIGTYKTTREELEKYINNKMEQN